MKTKIVSIVIFIVIILSVCIFEVAITNETIDRVKQTNYKVIEMANDDNISNTTLYNELNEIGDFWANRENFLCLIFNHKDMMELGKEIEQAKSYLKQDNRKEAVVHLELLTEDILSLEHIVLFNMQNLF